MTMTTQEDWLQVNQNCLIAEVNVVKAKVIAYKDSLSDDKNLENNGAQIEEAIYELSKTKEANGSNTRLNYLAELFQLSPFERNVLVLSIGIELDASLGKLVSKVQGDGQGQIPTISLVLSLFSDTHWSAFAPESSLRFWELITLNKNSVLTSSSFTIDEMVLHYVTGINSMDSRLHPFVSNIEIPEILVPSHQKIGNQITKLLSRADRDDKFPIIQLKGNSVEDQKAIVASIFSDYNLTTYCLPVQLLPGNFHDLVSLLKLWSREALLNQFVLFLDGKGLSGAAEENINHLKYFLEKVKGVVILSSELKIADLDRSIQIIKVEKPSRDEQQTLWKEQLGKVGEALNGEIGNLVSQFSLDSHTISHLAHQSMKNNNETLLSEPSTQQLKENLWDTCCDYTRPNLASLAQRIEAVATWDDIVLPAPQLETLKEICSHVQQRQKVYYDWGFSSKSNRGLGISALFAGESGTGKTMASEVIANALNLDLYRIDLSQVINKYIGETEKNLKKIFDAAENSGAILLFDEADALFGKRSEVKDSHDRHSNIEVSYLLQKMEEYRGLAILTTNMRNALDDAFLRRIRFVIQFPFPDAEMRGQIWSKAFPKQTPTDELNIRKLANLNVAGGNIRNIALNATFAAANKNQPVCMLDIHNAARNEYVKLEKHMSPGEALI